jgi:hypothetical protein
VVAFFAAFFVNALSSMSTVSQTALGLSRANMAWQIFAQNLLESATVSVSPAALAASPITRIYDRGRTFQYIGGSAAQTDIDIDLGSALPVSAIAFVNHNITGVTISIRADSSSPGTTERATLAATAADAVVTVSQTLRYWRVRIPAMASAPQLGELLLGVPRTIAQNPVLEGAARIRRPNVRIDESSGGYPVGVKLGAKRTVLQPVWNWIDPTDVAALNGAADDCNDGTKSLLLKDEMDVLRWMFWRVPELKPVPITVTTSGATAYAIADGGEFVEVPA